MAAVLKTAIPQKGIGGSNPPASECCSLIMNNIKRRATQLLVSREDENVGAMFAQGEPRDGG